MSISIFKVIGIIGLIGIISGLLVKSRIRRNILYIVGGLALMLYSIYLKDVIFTILQIIFTIAALYDLWKTKSAHS